MSTLFGMVDMVMVGRVGSARDYSRGVDEPAFYVTVVGFAAVNIGTTTLVGLADRRRQTGGSTGDNFRQTVLVISLVLGALVCGVGVPSWPPGLLAFWARDPTRLPTLPFIFRLWRLAW